MRTITQVDFHIGLWVPSQVRLSTEKKRKVQRFKHSQRRGKRKKGGRW